MSTLQVNRLKHALYTLFSWKKILIAYCEKYNLRFSFFFRDGIGRDIYYKFGVYAEDFITDFLLKEINLQDDDLILDIGANIGWYSLVLSYQKNPQVFAFEPDPFNFARLQQNIELNHKKNITAVNAAIANQEGTATLHLYKKYNLSRHSLINQQKSVKSIEVKTIRLDDFMCSEGLGEKKIKLIKIDIEGFELEAMRGAIQCLQRCEYLLSEFTPKMMKEINQNPMDYIDLIRNAGFTIYDITQKGLQQPDFEACIDNNLQLNLFCRRE